MRLLNNSEKFGDPPKNPSQLSNFKDCIQTSGLFDLDSVNS